MTPTALSPDPDSDTLAALLAAVVLAWIFLSLAIGGAA